MYNFYILFTDVDLMESSDRTIFIINIILCHCKLYFLSKDTS